jgi:hypothetical protein
MDPTCEDAFTLYQRCISSDAVEYLQKQAQVKSRRSIYTPQVVIRLMILQRLRPRGTLATQCHSFFPIPVILHFALVVGRAILPAAAF